MNSYIKVFAGLTREDGERSVAVPGLNAKRVNRGRARVVSAANLGLKMAVNRSSPRPAGICGMQAIENNRLSGFIFRVNGLYF